MEKIANLENIASPALLLFPDRIERNIVKMVEICAGDPGLLRPHVKTHKLAEVLEMQQRHGIHKVKCATIAEVEMAASAGVSQVLLAYQPVGPNIDRLLRLRDLFPKVKISALVDNSETLAAIANAVEKANQTPLKLFIDLDTGMQRTGIAPGEKACELAQEIAQNSHTEFAGVHAYDGHIHDADLEDRKASFAKSQELLLNFLADLEKTGLAIPTVVAGGSPTFALHAEFAQTQEHWNWECSPGTPLLWDAGYGTNHADLEFEKAAVLLSRVISKPGNNRICIDLGHKAVSAENPIERRVIFPALPDATFVSQSEEHLVLEITNADSWQVGDEILGYPWHVCPSLALHAEATLIEENRATQERWTIHARNRRITV